MSRRTVVQSGGEESATPPVAFELRVQRHRGLIDVYQLLGLPRWETDAGRIAAAIARAQAVQAQAVPAARSRDHAQFAGYVVEAERILTDPARKGRYDESLRRALALNENAPTEAPTPVDPVVRPQGKSPSSVAPVARPTVHRSAPDASRRFPTEARTPIGERLVDAVRDTCENAITRAADWWEYLHGGAPIRFTLAIVSCLGVISLLLYQVDWNARFPTNPAVSKATGEQTVTATLPRLKAPSAPGLRIGVPYTVSGLEDVPAYAPSLDATMTTIVFAVEDGAREARNFDLYLAVRDKPGAAFRRPERLVSCCTEDAETDPALSPDGLELVFVRSTRDGQCQFLRSLRKSATASFGEPEPLVLAGMTVAGQWQYDSPQLVRNGGDLVFRASSGSDAGARKSPVYFVARRDAADRPFGQAKPLPVFIDASRHYLTGDGLRAFVAGHHAIQLCCRPSHEAPFSAPGKLDRLDAARIGHAEGPIWVSPAEDVMFYCVTIVDQGRHRRRQLRQIRFR